MNARPSLRFDVMRATDIFGSRLTPPGLLLQDLHQAAPPVAALREGAPQRGRPRQARAAARQHREWRTEYRRRHADVLVIGGGVAGMSAALRAAELGADVVLVDDGPELGGTALLGDGPDPVDELAQRVRAAGVEVLAPAAALGYFDGIVPVWTQSTLHQIRAERHIAATGSIEQPLMFEGNDLPGRDAVLGRASDSPRSTGCRPGRSAVVATTADRGLESAPCAPRAPGSRSSPSPTRAPAVRRRDLLARLEAARIPLLRGQHRGPRRGAPAGDRSGRRGARPGRPRARRHRARSGLRPGRRLRRHGSRDLAAAAGRRQGALGRVRGRLRPGSHAGRDPTPPEP